MVQVWLSGAVAERLGQVGDDVALGVHGGQGIEDGRADHLGRQGPPTGDRAEAVALGLQPPGQRPAVARRALVGREVAAVGSRSTPGWPWSSMTRSRRPRPAATKARANHRDGDQCGAATSAQQSASSQRIWAIRAGRTGAVGRACRRPMCPVKALAKAFVFTESKTCARWPGPVGRDGWAIGINSALFSGTRRADTTDVRTNPSATPDSHVARTLSPLAPVSFASSGPSHSDHAEDTGLAPLPKRVAEADDAQGAVADPVGVRAASCSSAPWCWCSTLEHDVEGLRADQAEEQLRIEQSYAASRRRWRGPPSGWAGSRPRPARSRRRRASSTCSSRPCAWARCRPSSGRGSAGPSTGWWSRWSGAEGRPGHHRRHPHARASAGC